MRVFDVYKNGELVGKRMAFQEVQNLLQITSIKLSQCIDERKSDQLEINGYTVHVIALEINYDGFSKKHKEQWDDRKDAAELIRTGKGKIITKMVDGKPRKVTVPR